MYFKAYGHKNITGKHLTTIEFTRHKELSLRGDCILGVNADFDLLKLKNFLKNKMMEGKDIQITVEVGKQRETIKCQINPEFDDRDEIVIRRSEYSSKRTLGIKADRACVDFKRSIVEKMKNPRRVIRVSLS